MLGIIWGAALEEWSLSQSRDTSKVKLAFAYPGKDGDVEDKDTDEGTELSETGDEEPNPRSQKKTRTQRLTEVCWKYIASLTLLSQIVTDNKKSREKRRRQ